MAALVESALKLTQAFTQTHQDSSADALTIELSQLRSKSHDQIIIAMTLKYSLLILYFWFSEAIQVVFYLIL